MKRVRILLLATAFMLAAAAYGTAQSAETNIFGIELGQVIGYNFDQEEVGVGNLMAIQFGMTDSMELGFVFISGDGAPNFDMPNFNLVRLSYYVQDMVAFRLSTGNSGNNLAGGVGVVTAPFRRTINDTLTTSLNISLDYLIPDVDSDFDEGVLAVGITGKVAF